MIVEAPKRLCNADAEAATLPFVIRFNVTLPHYHNVDVLKLAAANGLHRVESWIKVQIVVPCNMDIQNTYIILNVPKCAHVEADYRQISNFGKSFASQIYHLRLHSKENLLPELRQTITWPVMGNYMPSVPVNDTLNMLQAGVSRPSIVESTLADETIISNWSKFVKPFGK